MAAKTFSYQGKLDFLYFMIMLSKRAHMGLKIQRTLKSSIYWILKHIFVSLTHFLKSPSYLKDTHRESMPSNKTQALTKSVNMENWLIGTLNQLFIWGSYIQFQFSKIKICSWQNSVLCNLAFDRTVLYGKIAASIQLNGTPVFKKMFWFFQKLISKLKH